MPLTLMILIVVKTTIMAMAMALRSQMFSAYSVELITYAEKV